MLISPNSWSLCQDLRECLGLQVCSEGTFCHTLLAVVAGWLVWILAEPAPCTAARLLYACALEHADFVLVRVSLPVA